MKIKKGDEVMVMTGKDNGKRGKVLRVVDNGKRVLVEKLNIVKKHSKPTEKDPRGGIVDKEAPIHVSNVMLVSSKVGRPVRVNHKIVERGDKKIKIRYSHKLNEALD
jgi:large subunit ribosomal protein L24